MTKLEGKDARRPPWFWADNKLVDDYAAKIGIHALGVYVVLVRHLNGDDECWPSTATIAKKLGISQRTVVKAIQTLKDEGLIEITPREQQGKGQISNLYTVHRLSSPVQDQPDTPMQEVHRGMQDMHRPYAPDAGAPMHDVHTNKTNKNKTQGTSGGVAPDGEIVQRLKALTYDDRQINTIFAAAAGRGGFTLADVELGERWIDEQRPEWTGKFGKLYNIWKAGDVPVLTRTGSTRSSRVGPVLGGAPEYTEAEAKQRGAARKAELLKGLPANA